MNELIDFICSDGFDNPVFIVKILVLLFICGFYASAIRSLGRWM